MHIEKTISQPEPPTGRGERFRPLDAGAIARRETAARHWLAHNTVVPAADCRAITAKQMPDKRQTRASDRS